MINIHFSKNNIVTRRCWSFNCEMLLCPFKSDILKPQRFKFQTLSPKGSFHISVHPEFIYIIKGMTSTYGRMVTHLLCKVEIIWILYFKGFTQDWIKWFIKSFIGAFVLCYSKCSYIQQSFHWGLLLISLH